MVGTRSINDAVDVFSRTRNPTIIWGNGIRDITYGSRINGVYLSPVTYRPTVAIGGTCLLSTGDLREISNGNLPNGVSIDKIDPIGSISQWMEGNLPRLDQIRDSVGVLDLDKYFVVFEDDLFADLVVNRLGLDGNQRKELEKSFQALGAKCAEWIRQWLGIVKGRQVEVVYVFSSSVREESLESVKYVAEKSGDASFIGKEKSRVNLMYTQLWIDILKKYGILQKDDVAICSEPIQHLMEVLESEREGYRGAIQKYLRENPWGSSGENEGFSAFGFVPTIVPNKTTRSPFSRYYKRGEVVGRGRNTEVLATYSSASPFPLDENPIMRDAINFLFFDPGTLDKIEELMQLEIEFRKRKKSIKSDRSLDIRSEMDDVRKSFTGAAQRILGELNSRLMDLYLTLEFGGD